MENAEHAPAQLEHVHFLVAMNDAVEARAVIAALQPIGATSITDVRDGHMALRWLQETNADKIDVAIVDLDLAGVDALELMRALAAAESRVQLIVLGALTSHVMFSVETLAQAYGVDLLGTVVKPATGARLQALLANYAAPVERAARVPGPVFGLADVAAALKARQFEPFFQPKIALATGQVTGLEAFARWRHPEHGVLGPDSFIDAFEANQRIGFLDWSMIDQ